jgi:glycosyltransferase involved in cell wall biosynthesis
VVGAVGRLSKEKAFDLLIQAMPRLLAKGIDVELHIAGDGDQAGPLRDLVASLGLGDRVHLVGFCPDTAGLYQAMDVCVLSSLREGLPNVLLEAMAMEVPVVATRIAGVPRLVLDGENGLLVDAGSVEALAGALTTLLGDAGLRARLGREGRQTVETSYSFRERISKIRAIYDELLQPDLRVP